MVLAISVFAVNGLPQKPAREGNAKSIVGLASHIVTNSLLQGHQDASNFVFSPLGFSSILAILKEGARGETLKEIEKVLNFEDASVEDIRRSYESALKHLGDSNAQMSPQFKTWFYIYKNNTVEEEFKNVIEKFYSVDVKEIKRFSFSDSSDSDSENEDEFTYPSEDLEFSDEKSSNKEEEVPEKKKKIDMTNTFKKLKLAIVNAEVSHQKNSVADKSDSKPSKFDKNIDDKQYEEVEKIKEQIKEEKIKEEKKEVEKTDEKEKKTEEEKKPEVEKPSKKEQETEKKETIAQLAQMRSFAEDDVTSGLSGNSIVGKKNEDSEELESKMLLFNGLYFRGNWLSPFQVRPADVFYNSTAQKTQITMMRTRGIFKTAFVKSVDAHAVEIPYENERYALLVVMPKSHSGIASFVKQYTLSTLEQIDREMKEEHVHLALPKFKVETTGRAEKPFAKSGITSLFTRKADLSGITKEQHLHVDELVQHVAVRVDEGAISQNAFSATNAVRSSPIADKELVIDHPFLFFVRDIVDDLIVVAGAINHVPANKPVSFF
ncbi:serpin B4-like [Culicoides brevitarsis]|uniref:serpin B4-like n=1 Tax=Culicoides brevitarsis TaxID=469753 RepID=UPI00307B66A4